MKHQTPKTKLNNEQIFVDNLDGATIIITLQCNILRKGQDTMNNNRKKHIQC